MCLEVKNYGPWGWIKTIFTSPKKKKKHLYFISQQQIVYHQQLQSQFFNHIQTYFLDYTVFFALNSRSAISFRDFWLGNHFEHQDPIVDFWFGHLVWKCGYLTKRIHLVVTSSWGCRMCRLYDFSSIKGLVGLIWMTDASLISVIDNRVLYEALLILSWSVAYLVVYCLGNFYLEARGLRENWC